MILNKLINHSPVTWNHQNTISFNGNRGFCHNYSEKSLDFCQGFKYGNGQGCKTLAKWLLKITGKHLHKRCIGTRRIMPCVHIHVFISFSFLCFIFQARRQLFSLSTLHFIIHFIDTAIVKNRCCVFLASTLNSLCFIGNPLSVPNNTRHQRCI